ncbi:MAG: beta-ketoacyl-ACP synthase II [Alistipes sp.]|jgi:3-oxoacyl-[acyl-carrier-protein] synthase II|nr:beta-ketoacyl-ACP synthase II [Alistipes sp.]MBQ5902780.1 beta-ketoacyl-ACP synthase II [Alistipes sp.]
MAERRVVVTGIGTINPLGKSVEEFFTNLKAGVSAAAPITYFDTEKFKTKFACEIKDYDPSEYFDRKEARRYDLFTQYAIIAADQAIEDAAFDFAQLDLEQCGVISSSGVGGIKSLFDESVGYAEGGNTPRFSPFFVPRMIIDIAAGFISMKHGFMGPNYSVVSACASSNHAMINAMEAVRYGRADVILTVGSDATVNEVTVGAFNAMQALSTRNDDCEHASSPFDKDRDGFVVGEGAAAFVFEELEHAKKRGAKIYCEVAGGGASADAYHFTAPHPEGRGAIKSMRDALRDAHISSDEIDYINVHGTSTPLGDVAEIKALQEVFGDKLPSINISSTKSMHGHLLGATGAVEALACVMTLTEGVVAPTINCRNLDPEIPAELNLTLDKAQMRDVKYALSNSFGFGGHNATIILKKYQPEAE